MDAGLSTDLHLSQDPLVFFSGDDDEITKFSNC